MAEDERIDEESASVEEAEDVEAHGAKHVVAAGLAGAALIGAGAASVKLTGDDEPQRNQGALLSPEARNIQAADLDGDGYVNYRELAHEGFKFSVEPLNAEGIDVTAEGLSAAGHKVEVELVGKEEGFALEGDTIMLKQGVDSELDKLAEGTALEWTKKIREIDRDGDGYASYEELSASDWYKWNVAELNEAGYEVTAEELGKAGYKMNLGLIGEGGFVTQDDMIMLKLGLDDKLDALIKGEQG